MGLFDFLKPKSTASYEHGLHKTKESFLGRIARVLTGRTTIDDDLLDEIEEILITADVGVNTTMELIDILRTEAAEKKVTQSEELLGVLKTAVAKMLEGATNKQANITPGHHVIMVVGVNGVGKTTSIGKLAHHYVKAGKQVCLGAADTFRAAAAEQLEIWGTRSGARVVTQAHGADPAAVAFDTLKSVQAKGEEIAIIDTAGRLHNKTQLMAELTKIRNVMHKVIPNAPHEVLLVLDASTGQNAIQQAKHFAAATDVTGIILTKLDGTAKGGVVIGIARELNIPVQYIGLGEGIDDLQPFEPEKFVESLFG